VSYHQNMLTPKLAIGLFLASLFVAPSAPICAQQPSVGLLLARVSHARGTEVLDSPSVIQYETLWVVRDASGAHIAVTLPDIIEPRKTGFWRLGIAHTCQLTPPSYSSPKGPGTISTQDLAYAVPVERTPVVQLNAPSPPCDADTAQRVFDDSYRLYAGDSPQPPDPNAPSQCGWQNLSFTSVLPDFVSLSYDQGLSENCDPRGSNSFQKIWVQSPDDPLSALDPTQKYKLIPFGQIFGPVGHRAWVRAVTSESGGNSCLADVPKEELDNQTAWSLVHFSGKWVAYAFAQEGRDCAGFGYPKVTVPRSLTHTAPLPIPWPALEKQLPGISDAYLSPSGSILVAIVSAQKPQRVVSITLFDFSENKLGAKLLDLPPGDVVMAEWATGRFVQSWTDTLTALKSHGLPAVVVKPASSN
jgi:hypothetical protein